MSAESFVWQLNLGKEKLPRRPLPNPLCIALSARAEGGACRPALVSHNAYRTKGEAEATLCGPEGAPPSHSLEPEGTEAVSELCLL